MTSTPSSSSCRRSTTSSVTGTISVPWRGQLPALSAAAHRDDRRRRRRALRRAARPSTTTRSLSSTARSILARWCASTCCWRSMTPGCAAPTALVCARCAAPTSRAGPCGCDDVVVDDRWSVLDQLRPTDPSECSRAHLSVAKHSDATKHSDGAGGSAAVARPVAWSSPNFVPETNDGRSQEEEVEVEES